MAAGRFRVRTSNIVPSGKPQLQWTPHFPLLFGGELHVYLCRILQARRASQLLSGLGPPIGLLLVSSCILEGEARRDDKLDIVSSHRRRHGRTSVAGLEWSVVLSSRSSAGSSIRVIFIHSVWEASSTANRCNAQRPSRHKQCLHQEPQDSKVKRRPSATKRHVSGGAQGKNAGMGSRWNGSHDICRATLTKLWSADVLA